jgi:exonuclease VII small subunit
MLDSTKKHEEQIMRLQEEILSKVKEKSAAIKSQVAESKKAKDKFKSFFDKKNSVEELIRRIESEKLELEESFKKLEKKALAFDLSTKTTTVTSHVKTLEKDYMEINKKKNGLKLDLEKLTRLIKG